MPPAFINLPKGPRYSATALLQYLSARTSDTLSPIIGITHDDIYVSDKDANGKVKEPRSKYEVWGIFGLGSCPGRACVVSDYRLQTSDHDKFQHRMRTVVIHEIGHNLGLPHCNTLHCIMNDANEKIATVDNSSRDLCESCKHKLQ